MLRLQFTWPGHTVADWKEQQQTAELLKHAISCQADGHILEVRQGYLAVEEY